MAKIAYIDWIFHDKTLAIIHAANSIIQEYLEAGFKLTLRQLYYQFVARGLIPNTIREYGKLGVAINNGRLAGLIDWNAIEDRTRNLASLSHWEDPSDIVHAAAESFRIDKWADQEYRPEIWIEKEALAGIVEGVCHELDVPFFCCRGYVSQSEMWGASQRLYRYHRQNQKPVIIHLGDHDPSGIDMTRDIIDRMDVFRCSIVEVDRIALNMDQVKQYQPPPNPAKVTDTRFHAYMKRFGKDSWELDALKPQILAALIKQTVLDLRDDDKWDAQVEQENQYREKLSDAAYNYDWEGENGD